MGFEVIPLSRDITACNLIVECQCFYSVDGDSKLLRIVGIYLPICTASHTRIPSSQYSTPVKTLHLKVKLFFSPAV